jgi:hypothetical protein
MWVRSRLCKLQNGCTRFTSLPVACPWSVVLSGIPASSTTKTGHHDITEILLKVALNIKDQIKSNRLAASE